MFADVLTTIVTMLGVKVLNTLAAQGMAVPLGVSPPVSSYETRSKDLKSCEKNYRDMELLSVQNSCLSINQLG